MKMAYSSLILLTMSTLLSAGLAPYRSGVIRGSKSVSEIQKQQEKIKAQRQAQLKKLAVQRQSILMAREESTKKIDKSKLPWWQRWKINLNEYLFGWTPEYEDYYYSHQPNDRELLLTPAEFEEDQRIKKFYASPDGKRLMEALSYDSEKDED